MEAKGAAELREASSEKELEERRVRYLGRKARLTQILRSLSSLSDADRKIIGKDGNRIKALLEGLLEGKLAEQGAKEEKQPEIDLTLPGRSLWKGKKHVVLSVLERIEEIFYGMGFSIFLGPDVEDDYHNFEALNIPSHHPARESHDTFFVEGGLLMRTHTSPVQIRAMKSMKPPVRMIFPGRVYRNEASDATHTPEFYQVEGLYVDSQVSLGDLKGTLEEFAREMFRRDIQTRFRPSHFPFTEPSGEMDVICIHCDGKGCPVCKGSGWLEILGCGMVHPNVLRNVGYDPLSVSGYAFGMGVERVAMLKYKVNDMRLFYENDIRFLRQEETL
ncbi:MAG: phenylalanine--tRNA ligase subunit alpha [Candidatus Eisenbacteria bacterium]|nr:phenylalanine--tRNA ligase subunit alpha [Candidatus Eisenbacteria bacterium]